jgi:hypothetical protein
MAARLRTRLAPDDLDALLIIAALIAKFASVGQGGAELLFDKVLVLAAYVETMHCHRRLPALVYEVQATDAASGGRAEAASLLRIFRCVVERLTELDLDSPTGRPGDVASSSGVGEYGRPAQEMAELLHHLRCQLRIIPRAERTRARLAALLGGAGAASGEWGQKNCSTTGSMAHTFETALEALRGRRVEAFDG